MKNWEKVNEVWDEIPGGDEGTDHWRQICHAFNVDPDAEYVEPAKPQPEAEYDAGWTWAFYSSQFHGYGALASDPRHKVTYPKAVAAVAAEAARREREACKAREQQWIDAGVRSVVSIRCLAHRYVPPYNINEMGGGECAACEVEALRAERETEARRADTIVCIANGEDPGGYEDSTAMIAVRALRAERDRMAAEIESLKTKLLIAGQRATNAIERARVLGDRIGVLEAERDEMAAKVGVLHATCREYEQRIADLQKRLVRPSADLAGIVERARKYAEVWNHDTVTTLIYDLAQAVAGMGGGK